MLCSYIPKFVSISEHVVAVVVVQLNVMNQYV